MLNGGLNRNDDSVNKYQSAKEEMNRLGFASYDEYIDYLEFMKIKSRELNKTLNGGKVEYPIQGLILYI